MVEPVTFTEHPDGSVTASRFPEEIDFSEQLVAQADPRFCYRRDDRLHISVANGCACYLVTGPSPDDAPGVYHAVRLWGDGRG